MFSLIGVRKKLEKVEVLYAEALKQRDAARASVQTYERLQVDYRYAIQRAEDNIRHLNNRLLIKQTADALRVKREELAREIVLRGHSAGYAITQAAEVYPDGK